MKLRKQPVISYALFILILLPIANALSIDMTMGDSFNEGDKISLDYSISHTADLGISYVVFVNCPNVPQPLLEAKKAELKANVELKGTYDYSIVDGTIESQDCTATLEITEPFVLREEKRFSIITRPGLKLDIKLEKKVYSKGEIISLGYSSDVQTPSIKSVLTYPNGDSEEIKLSDPIKAVQIGTYSLEITASKSGYKTATKKEQFAVIEKEAEIEFAGKCNANRICDNEETPQNCPMDCVSGLEKQLKVTNYLLAAVLIIILAAILIFAGYKIRSRPKDQRKEMLDLGNYIINARKSGYSDDAIKTALLKSKWPKEEIYKAFESLKK